MYVTCPLLRCSPAFANLGVWCGDIWCCMFVKAVATGTVNMTTLVELMRDFEMTWLIVELY